jgi:pyruvate/2-oxoglutarate/acetoin dehydrogenase E1 component
MTIMTYREAVRSALETALRDDPRVFLMGEDVGRYGGAYAVTKGMQAEWGEDRIRDTPLCESTFTGAGIGAAIAGMRPIIEIMTVNFSLLALDQLVNNAATLRHMSGGQIGVPLVVRMATGAGRQLAAQHSHSLEGWYAHIPGTKTVAPATPADARGLLLAAILDPDPVFVFEHQLLYGMEGEVDASAGPAEIGKAVLRREGSDASLVTYGGSLGKCLAAAAELSQEGIEVDVLDLRTLRPLDVSALMATTAKTGRVVVVDEGWKTAGFSAEIMATIVEHAFYDLDAPILRIAGAEVPVPYAKHLEDAALPQTPAIVQAVKESCARD